MNMAVEFTDREASYQAADAFEWVAIVTRDRRVLLSFAIVE
jgi:hypothetical protein